MRLQTKTSELLTLELKYDRKLRECEDIEDRLRETELEVSSLSCSLVPMER